MGPESNALATHRLSPSIVKVNVKNSGPKRQWSRHVYKTHTTQLIESNSADIKVIIKTKFKLATKIQIICRRF